MTETQSTAPKYGEAGAAGYTITARSTEYFAVPTDEIRIYIWADGTIRVIPEPGREAESAYEHPNRPQGPLAPEWMRR